MDKLFAVGIGIALGWWLKTASDDRKRLKEENDRLKARLENKE